MRGKGVIIIILFFSWIIYTVASYLSSESLPVFNPPTMVKSEAPAIFKTRLVSVSDVFKENVYEQCKSFSPQFPLSSKDDQRNVTLQDIYLLLRYSPRRDNEYGLYLQISTSYLISQNLQQLSLEQQSRTKVAVFLSEDYPTDMYNRLQKWFKSIYQPYTSSVDIIRSIDGQQASWEFMMNYTKYNSDIHFDTILFILEDEYIFDIDMLSDTIDFFMTYNPCFVHQTDYSERCETNRNDDDYTFLLVPGKTRLWRSLTSTTTTYACRLKTFLAFEDMLMHATKDWKTSPRMIRDRVGNTAIFCAIPSYSSHIETLLLPVEVNITINSDMGAYYKDWWSMARHALVEAQTKESFPIERINEENLLKNEVTNE